MKCLKCTRSTDDVSQMCPGCWEHYSKIYKTKLTDRFILDYTISELGALVEYMITQKNLHLAEHYLNVFNNKVKNAIGLSSSSIS